MKTEFKKIFFVIAIITLLPLATYSADVNLHLQISPSSTGGGGASGGTTIPVTQQTNTVSGWTSGSAFVEIIIDNKVIATTTALVNGSFAFQTQISASKVITVRSTDIFGALTTVSTTTSSGTNPIFENIILPPSLSMPTSSIARGTPLIGRGRTVPNAVLSIVLNDAKNFKKTITPITDALGNFSFSLDTNSLSEGNYNLQISLNFSGKTETTSSAVIILNGSKTPIKTPPPSGVCQGFADLNCDGKVDLRDVSIMLTSFGKKSVPPKNDLNHDGKINLVDFSIMLFYLKHQPNGKLIAAFVDEKTETQQPLKIYLDIGPGLDGEWLAAWNIADEKSKVKKVEISTDNGTTWHEAESPYNLGVKKPTSVTVRASDESGNTGHAEFKDQSPLQVALAILLGVIIAICLIITTSKLTTRYHA